MVLSFFKTICKIFLYCTIGLFSVFSTIELLNIAITGVQINSLARLSVKQACVFFEQETYKRKDTGGGVEVANLKTKDGVITDIGGSFYQGNDSESIYSWLYGAGSRFMEDGKVLEGNWVNYDLLRDVASTNNQSFLGEFYREAQMTPMNLGVPYVDKGVINEISKWNLATILNNGVYDENTGGMFSLSIGDNGKVYSYYKGFEINISDFDVTDIEYRVLDLRKPNDAKTFKEFTNMDADVILERIGGDNDESSKVALVGLTYRLKTKYTGVTPIGTFIGNMLDEEIGVKKVQGLKDDSKYNENENVLKGNFDFEQEVEVSGGGFEIGSNRNTNLPVDTSVVYFIVR